MNAIVDPVFLLHCRLLQHWKVLLGRRPLRRPLASPWLIAIFVIVLPRAAIAQIIIQRGKGTPPASLQGDWYHDTLANCAWTQHDSRWVFEREYGYGIFELETCGKDLVRLRDQNGYWRFATQSGQMIAFGTDVECFEEVAVMSVTPSFFTFYKEDQVLGFTQILPEQDAEYPFFLPVADTIQGSAAYCVSSHPITPRMREEDSGIHGWGMLGVNGQWLIEPKFDKPFRFQNGFAEVLYYGQKRRINEKGELIP